MLDIKVYKVPQLMSKRINVITVNGIPICTVRGKKSTSDIVSKLSGYDVHICDGRIDKLIDNFLYEKPKTFNNAEQSYLQSAT